MPTNRFDIVDICTGAAKPIRGDGTLSAIGKLPVSGPVLIGFLGIESDIQADLAVHGGPDKALHLYAHDHYPHWKTFLGQPGSDTHAALNHAGAFGENLCVAGLTEDDLWLGDRFRVGTAGVEISMGRQPCWKLNAHFNHKGVMAHMVETGFCGAYLRVIETGTASAHDSFVRESRGDPDWPLPRLFRALVSNQIALSKPELAALATHPTLGKSWRERARKRLGSQI